ncbi:MAG: zf-HC2 domain-containing protein [Verrucomicrobiota bacterium]
MNCRKTKQLLHDFTDGRLAESVAREVQRHVAECSDCRVFQRRDRQLQQLLAVKRHETPDPNYFNNFLGEFHQRLADATAPRTTFWQRLADRFNLDPLVALRPTLAPALGAAFVVALLLRGSTVPVRVESNTATAALTADTPTVLAVAQTDSRTPRYVLDRIAMTPASYEVASIHF